MDQSTETHEEPVPDQSLWGWFIYLLTVSIIFSLFGRKSIDFVFYGTISLILLYASSPDIISLFNLVIRIPGLRDLCQRLAIATEQGYIELLAMVPYQRFALQEQPSNHREGHAAAAANAGQKRRSSDFLIEWPENRSAPIAEIKSTEESIDRRDTVEAEKRQVCPSESAATGRLIDEDVSLKNETTLQPNPETTEKPTDVQTSFGADKDAPLEDVAPKVETSVDGRRRSTAIKDAPSRIDRKVTTKRVSFAIPDERVNSRAVTPEPKAIQSTKRRREDDDLEAFDGHSEHAAKRGRHDDWASLQKKEDDTPPQVPLRNHCEVVLKRLGKLDDSLSRLSNYVQDQPAFSTMLMTRTLRMSKVYGVVKRRMTGVAFQSSKLSLFDRVLTNHRRTREKRGGRWHSFVTEQAVANTGIGADDSMVGLEFNEEANGQAEAVELMDIREDNPEDLELPDADSTEIQESEDADEMELDDESPSPDGDSGFVDGDSMDIEETDTRLGARKASMKVQSKLRCAKDPLRTVFKIKASSRKIISGFKGASAQLAQQHAAPASMSVTAVADTSVLPGVAQVSRSTNSAADLREARLGKRPEVKAAPAQVAGPSPSLAIKSALPIPSPASTLPSPSLPAGTISEDGDASDTTPATTSPASAPPSSASSTPPVLPLAENLASSQDGSSFKPASAKAKATAPEKQNRKRGSEESVGELEKPSVNRGDGGMPASPSSNVSVTRRVLLAKAGNRKVRAKSTIVVQAEDDRVPGAPSASRATESAPEQCPCPKRIQRQRSSNAEPDQEIVPLNDHAGQAPTAEEVQKDQLAATFDSFPDAEFGEPDLDWPSDEDEPPVVRGRRANAGKAEKEDGNGKAEKREGKGK